VTASRRPAALRALTRELDDTRSPVRRFLDERYTRGRRDVQRRFCAAAPPLAVPAAPGDAANPGTAGTAADWLLRFLLHPQPEIHLAVAGAVAAGQAGIIMLPALADLAATLGVPLPERPPERARVFTGPVPGSTAEPGLLARSCWALALLTEVYRGGPAVAAAGPLARLRGGQVSGADLLQLAPPAGIDQLARFRRVFETALLPQLATRTGPWALGPTFTGSQLINADADLIAAGLLLDLKTSAKLTLGITDLLQLAGYALLDFDDQYQLTEVGLFNARYAHLATWDLRALLTELAGRDVDLDAARAEFQDFLHNLRLSGAAVRRRGACLRYGQVAADVVVGLAGAERQPPPALGPGRGRASRWLSPC